MSSAQKKEADLAARAKDSAYWAQVHIRSDRSKAISIAAPLKRLVMAGGGVRTERGNGGLRPDKRP